MRIPIPPMAARVSALGLLAALAGCGTATYASIDSTPPGARIYVQGIDTGHVTPARLDLEAYADDPDRPMQVELRMEGYVPTCTMPYPPRHRCQMPVCEHKRRGTSSRTLPLFERGSGLRVDTRTASYDIAIDERPWRAVDGAGEAPEAAAGVTVPLSPGQHVLRWRRSDPSERRSKPGHAVSVEIPDRGYVAVFFHRWPWGIPAAHDEDHPPQNADPARQVDTE